MHDNIKVVIKYKVWLEFVDMVMDLFSSSSQMALQSNADLRLLNGLAPVSSVA